MTEEEYEILSISKELGIGYFNLFETNERYRKYVKEWVNVHVNSRGVKGESRVPFIKCCLQKAFEEYSKKMDIILEYLS
jgi:hypothetical protein